MIAVSQVQAYQIPGVGGLVAAVKEQNGRGIVVSPLKKMKALAAYHCLARHVPNVGAVGNTEFGCALEEAAKLRGLRHVAGCQGLGELVEEHLTSLSAGAAPGDPDERDAMVAAHLESRGCRG